MASAVFVVSIILSYYYNLTVANFEVLLEVQAQRGYLVNFIGLYSFTKPICYRFLLYMFTVDWILTPHTYMSSLEARRWTLWASFLMSHNFGVVLLPFLVSFLFVYFFTISMSVLATEGVVSDSFIAKCERRIVPLTHPSFHHEFSVVYRSYYYRETRVIDRRC